jgi:hypothetical protein
MIEIMMKVIAIGGLVIIHIHVVIKMWQCLTGTDELNCLDSQCTFDAFQCQNPQMNLSYCL